jgi:hypothetical protein
MLAARPHPGLGRALSRQAAVSHGGSVGAGITEPSGRSSVRCCAPAVRPCSHRSCSREPEGVLNTVNCRDRVRGAAAGGAGVRRGEASGMAGGGGGRPRRRAGSGDPRGVGLGCVGADPGAVAGGGLSGGGAGAIAAVRGGGLFTAAGDAVARGCAGRPGRLLAGVFVVASLITAVLSLDATVVLLTPVVFSTAARLGAQPRPHGYAIAHLRTPPRCCCRSPTSPICWRSPPAE